jgi:hypothetical protein
MKLDAVFFNKFNCGYRIFAAKITGDNFKIDFIFYLMNFSFQMKVKSKSK